MFPPDMQDSSPPGKAWFCVRSKPKHEHIAASHLSKNGFEVFMPRIRYQQRWTGGIRRVTEALFPGYFFTLFDFKTSFRQVASSREVIGVVHFGDHWPAVPDTVIDELRRLVGNENMVCVDQQLEAGDTVRITEGQFEGLEAIVKQVMPGRQRVNLLMNFLGTEVCVQVDAGLIAKDSDARRAINDHLGPLRADAAPTVR
jgi:transcriptional antiterminator RfaH